MHGAGRHLADVSRGSFGAGQPRDQRYLIILVISAQHCTQVAVVTVMPARRGTKTAASNRRGRGAAMPPKSWVPKVVHGQERKDLSTPREPSTRMTQRLKKRRGRALMRKVYKVTETRAMRFVVQTTEPTEKRERQEWRIAKSIARGEPPVDLPLSLRKQSYQCPVCLAPHKRHCICGVEHIAKHDGDAFNKLVKWQQQHFPVESLADADDNRRMLIAFAKHASAARKKPLAATLRLLYLAGVTGRPETVESVGAHAIAGGAQKFGAGLASLDVVFRGGQRVGGNKLSLLARRTYRFPHHAGKRVMRHLQALRVHGKMSKTFAVAEKRRDALRSIVSAFSGNSGAPDWDDVPVIKFPCFGPY